MRTCYILILPFLFFACTNEIDNSGQNNLNFYNYHIDIKAKKVDFTSQIESISILGFEETDLSLLRPNSKFISYEKGFLVIDEGKGVVHIFDELGGFVRKFSHKGGGPEEYKTMQNTVYRDGYLETYDITNQSLFRYNLEGDFILRLKVPYKAAHVFFHDGGYLLSMGNKYEMDSTNYNIVFIDGSLQEYAKTRPFEEPSILPLRPDINDFRLVGEKVLLNTILTDSIFAIQGTEVVPYIHFDFGEDWHWAHGVSQTSANALGTIDGAGKVWALTWAIGKDRLEITYIIGFTEPQRGFIDRNTGEFYRYNYDWPGEQPPNYTMINFEEDKLLISCTIDVLDSFFSSLDESRFETIGELNLREIRKSENPVLMWVKFKSNLEY